MILPTSNNGITTTKIIHETTAVVDAVVALFSKTKNKADTYMNFTRPPLAIGFEPIKEAFLDARKRGVHLRYVTEITRDNLTYCKELMQIVHELRHLDAIKGNFMVSESEYIAPLILIESGKIGYQAIYSNASEVAEHQQYVFDNLWVNAISAEERMKDIEEGRSIHYETRILRNQDEIASRIKGLLENSNELLVCSGSSGLQLGYDRFLGLGNDLLTKSRRGEHKGIWLVTTAINRDSIEPLKILMDMGIQIKHINNMPPMNFSVTDKEIQATIDKMEGGDIARSVLVSNEPMYINHFRSIFEELWKNGVDAKIRIADIEQGVDSGEVDAIPSSSRAGELYLDFVRNAQKEIMIMFPTANAFLRQYNIGAIGLAIEAAQKRNVKVKVIMPKYESTDQLVRSLKEEGSPLPSHRVPNFDVRYIEQTVLDTHATVLVVDKRLYLVMEIRDDSKATFDEAIGLSIYSNSKAGVLSYLSLIENLWQQSKLYQQIKDSNSKLELANEKLDEANEQLKINNKMQQDFINIAAHELRTPIQPILGLSQILRRKSNDPIEGESLDIIVRNATRLQRLTEDILDVQRIESQTLQLNKERFDLYELISNVIAEYKNQIIKEKKITVDLLRNPNAMSTIVNADKNRLLQVYGNLLDNAIKFIIEEGTISIKISGSDNNSNAITVSVRDTGSGIDVDLLPRLFSKFVTKSFQGTGLGLFICKGIIETHGGRIWAENNKEGKGATFTFTLPALEEPINE